MRASIKEYRVTLRHASGMISTYRTFNWSKKEVRQEYAEKPSTNYKIVKIDRL